MKRIIVAVFATLTFALFAYAEPPTPPAKVPTTEALSPNAPAEMNTRKPAKIDPLDEAMEPLERDSLKVHRSRPDTAKLGAQVTLYYDPLLNADKLNTNNGIASQFTNQSATGVAGMEALFSVLTGGNFEFMSGFDYGFPVSLQGQQSNFGTYVVSDQNFNLMGVKMLQVGYHIDFSQFSVIPYGGFGVYYGQNVMNMTSSGVNNKVVYSKTMGVFSFGARGQFKVSDNFDIGAGLEGLLPTTISSQLSQSGTVTSELPGNESYLRDNMDFMTGVSLRLVAHVALHF